MAAAFVLAGCNQSAKTGSAPAKPGRMKIAVIPKGTTHDFWTSVHAGAEAAGKDLGVDIIWKGPTDEGRYADQISIVEDMITQKVDGIVLAPTHDQALADVVVKSHQKGIPISIFDSGIKCDPSNYVTFAATDNYKGGVLGAKRLAELLGGKGKVAMVMCQPGGASTMEREAGFRETLKKEFPGMELVDEKWGYSLREKSVNAAEDILTRSQGKLDGFFGSNESSAAGILQALKDRQLAGKVKFVGFDTSPDLIAGLEAGIIHGLVVQNPFKMGYEGVRSIVDFKAGRQVPKRIDTGAAVVTKENMNQPEMQKLINPPKLRPA
jgi:ribose transport system substrate-binding protein